MNNEFSSEIKMFLLKAYIDSVLDKKRKYYDLNIEETLEFDDGWGIPESLSFEEYEILRIFKYSKGYEDQELDYYYQNKQYKECDLNA